MPASMGSSTLWAAVSQRNSTPVATMYPTASTIDSSELEYQRVRHTAAHRWPASLGSVVEIGCGTGSFSRAMIAHREAADAVLTDVSTEMLRICIGHLDRLGIGTALPVRFATYSANEPCFCDAVFDTCIGTSVVHHITDVRALSRRCLALPQAGRPGLLRRAEPSLPSGRGDGIRGHHCVAAGSRP